MRRLIFALPLLFASAACGGEDPEADDCSDGSRQGPTTVASAEELAALEGCHTLHGSLYLWGTDATSLAPLASLEVIEGTLSIQRNPLLTDLRGLEGLSEVWGCLELRDNERLESADGVGGLTRVGTCLSIGTSDPTDKEPHGNPRLTNLDALSSLREVGMFVSIENNGQLAHLDGLASLRQVGGDLRIAKNAALASVSGLLSLERFEGEAVTIADNPVLPNCEAELLASELGASAEVHGNDADGTCAR
jgi:hypothetical protein